MKIVTKNTIKKECWNLDFEFVKWLNEHLKVYNEEASKIVDLGFHKFIYKKKTYTQKMIIDRLIEITNQYVKYEKDFWALTPESNETIREMLDLFELVYPTLWW